MENIRMNRIVLVLWVFSAVGIFSVCGHKFESTLGHLKATAAEDIQKSATENLIQRVVPNKYKDFSVVINSGLTDNGKDLFKIQKINNTVEITGTTGVAAATGFHYYLKYYCNAHISWDVSQLSLPEVLPEVDVVISINDRLRYYQNVCTTSYSFVWWDWNQWEKHIDWMALNSFNFVLAFNGQEAIWQRVYRKLNLTEVDINEHFSGPAFLSWLRMGNLRGWGGPLSQAWHDRSLYLQHKILERMRQLGIIPILPGFAGHVPRAFQRIFPDVNMTQMADWNTFPDKFCCPLFIDPTDDLFHTVGKMFIEEQIAEYGTDHVYNCDSFNEMNPQNDDLTYLADVGKGIYGAMKAADSQAIWVMQGWLFVHSFFFWTPDRAKALLTSVPIGNMIVLDLQSEQFPQFTRLNQYFGQPYIWCMLHNFGGTLGMYGSAGIINTDVLNTRNAENSTMIGIGLTMEGINQNYVIYDLMTEQAWRDDPIELTEWFRNYSRRRYGKEDVNAEKAWEGLQNTLYNFSGIERMRGQFVVTKTPSLNINTWAWYKYSDLFDAWKSFMLASDNLKDSPAYRHDLVDLTRQVLQVNGDIYYNKLVEAFRKRDVAQFQHELRTEIHVTTDKKAFPLLGSVPAPTTTARLWAGLTEEQSYICQAVQEEQLFEYGARNQISLWGPFGQIMNYAIKQWSGMVKDFLYPRWDEFIFAMNLSLVYDTRFNQLLQQAIIFVLYEEPFVFARNTYPTLAQGDTIEIAKTIESRYWYTNSEVLPDLKPIAESERTITKKYRKIIKRCEECPERSLLNARRSVSKINDLKNLEKYFSRD